MRVTSLSRAEFNQLTNEQLADKCVISISDTLQERDEMRAKLPETALCLRFLDTEGADSRFDHVCAKLIIDAVDEAFEKPRNDIIIHCFAGISRSGAVAKFVNEYLGLADVYLSHYTGHNKHVYNTLLEEAGIETMRAHYKRMESSS